MFIKIINKIIEPAGFKIGKIESIVPYDIVTDSKFMELYYKCKPFTMTSIERMYSLYQSINYVISKGIPGDFVECGVWKGGSSMLIALVLRERQQNDRKVYMYDTFEGMSEPTEADKDVRGDVARELLSKQNARDEDSIWCLSSLDEVKRNMASTGFDNIHFIRGKVEDTLLNYLPQQISLLRLDTDWYESTKMEMEKLYPLLVNKGVLIIDDFGHWEGAKKAILEYFSEKTLNPLLHRIDNTARIMIKED
jgi:O-methyltransferase